MGADEGGAMCFDGGAAEPTKTPFPFPSPAPSPCTPPVLPLHMSPSPPARSSAPPVRTMHVLRTGWGSHWSDISTLGHLKHFLNGCADMRKNRLVPGVLRWPVY